MLGEVAKVAILAQDISGRKEAEEALRRSQGHLYAVINNAPVIIFAIDQQGVVTMVEGKALASVGPILASALGQNCFDLLKEWPGTIDLLRQVLSGKKITGYVIDYLGKSFEISFAPMRDAQGQVIGLNGLALDVTDYKQAQQALLEAQQELEKHIVERTAELAETNQQLRAEIAERQKAEERIHRSAAQAEALVSVATRLNAQLDLKTVLETVCNEIVSAVDYPSCTVMLCDETGDQLQIVAVNEAANIESLQFVASIPRSLYESLFQENMSYVLIANLSKLSHLLNPEIRPVLRSRTIVSFPLKHNNELIGNLNVASLDEVHLPTESDLNLLTGLANQASAAIANARLFEQVSEGQQRLKALSQRLLELHETERCHMARELHDEIGQQLTYLSLVLDMSGQKAAKQTGTFQEMLAALANARSLIDELLKRVRALSLDLRPAMLDDLGLLPALLHLFERYTEQSSICIDFKHNLPQRRFPAHIETTAYRIIQEALTNVTRHAGVEEVNVRLWADEQVLGLQVEDQGRGFDAQTTLASATTGGLSGIRERVELCSGELEIESTPGGGTCLTAELPLIEIWSEYKP